MAQLFPDLLEYLFAFIQGGSRLLAIFTILASWNDLLWPLIMTSSEEMRVLSIGISSFQGQHSTDYPSLMAGALMATLPIIILFIFLQRYFIEGIAMNGIKDSARIARTMQKECTEMLQVLVIGAGTMGRTHAAAYASMPGVKLAGIADIRAEKHSAGG